MAPDAMKYWWRAQATGYLTRLNPRTVAALRALRTAPGSLVTAVGGAASEAGKLEPALRTSFPLPAGMTSIHVRHGDKVRFRVQRPDCRLRVALSCSLITPHSQVHKCPSHRTLLLCFNLQGREMTLVPSENYFTAAENRVVVPNPLSYVRAAFISTEDPGVRSRRYAVCESSDASLLYRVPFLSTYLSHPLSCMHSLNYSLTHVCAQVLEVARGYASNSNSGPLHNWGFVWYDVPRINRWVALKRETRCLVPRATAELCLRFRPN